MKTPHTRHTIKQWQIVLFSEFSRCLLVLSINTAKCLCNVRKLFKFASLFLDILWSDQLSLQQTGYDKEFRLFCQALKEITDNLELYEGVEKLSVSSFHLEPPPSPGKRSNSEDTDQHNIFYL